MDAYWGGVSTKVPDQHEKKNLVMPADAGLGDVSPAWAGARVFFAGWVGFIAWAVLLALGIWKGSASLAMLAAAAVSLSLAARLWARLSLAGLVYTKSLSATRAFPGEKVGLRQVLSNQKLLPLSWAEVAECVPEALWAGGAELPQGPREHSRWLVNGDSLSWHDQTQWGFELVCGNRGVHSLGPARVSTGDIFGLFTKVKEFKEPVQLIVYPRVFPMDRLGLPSRLPLGESRAASRMFEDPNRPLGIRDYQPGTPFKHIHWKASARRQRLQSKLFEPTTTLQVAVCLDVDGFTSAGGGADDVFELAVSTAASVACHVSQRRQPVGLFSNGIQEGLGKEAMLTPGRGPEGLAAVLEALARVTARPSRRFDALLDQAAGRLGRGSTLAVVAHGLERRLESRVLAMVERGMKAFVFLVGEGARPPAELDWLRVGSPENLEPGA